MSLKITNGEISIKLGGTGGSKTQTGLVFEKNIDFLTRISDFDGYSVQKQNIGSSVFFDGELVAQCFKKHDFCNWLNKKGVDWKSKIAKKLLPDDALLVSGRKTLFIIEIKYQQAAGAVDEKLQTCDFKRKQYLKLVADLGLKVEYVYVLNNWFRDPKYRDVLDYIHSVNCHYKFNELPLAWLGLPTK